MNDSTQPVSQDKWTEIMKDKNSNNNKSKLIGFLFILCFGPLGLLYTSITAAFITILAMVGSWVIVTVLFAINPVLGFLGMFAPLLIYLSIFVTYVKLSKDWEN